MRDAQEWENEQLEREMRQHTERPARIESLLENIDGNLVQMQSDISSIDTGLQDMQNQLRGMESFIGYSMSQSKKSSTSSFLLTIIAGLLIYVIFFR